MLKRFSQVIGLARQKASFTSAPQMANDTETVRAVKQHPDSQEVSDGEVQEIIDKQEY